MNIAKKLCTIGTLLITTLCLTGCGSNDNNTAKVNIGYFNNVTHAQALLMKSEESLEKALGEDIKVNWTSFNAGPAEVEALFSEDIDIGYIGPVPAVNANVKSNGDVMILTGATKGGAVVVKNKDSQINSISDFAGKNVAIPQIGNTQHLSLLKLLSDNNLKPVTEGGDVNITAVSNADVANVMERGDIDAAIVPEPWGATLEEAGADCLMLLPPFFLKPGGVYLYEHMKAVAQAVNIPIMAQYAPEQTGVAIQPETFVELEKECPNVIYYKIECKPAGPYVTKLMTLTDGEMKIFVGNAGFQIIECMDRGAVGAMPGCSMYDVYLDIYNNYVNGNRKEAMEIHNKLLPMLNHIRQNVEQIISFEKRILKRRGIISSDYCRKPSYNTDKYFDKLFDEFYDEMSERYGW